MNSYADVNAPVQVDSSSHTNYQKQIIPIANRGFMKLLKLTILAS